MAREKQNITSGKEYLKKRFGHFSNGVGLGKIMDDYINYLLETKQIKET